MSTNAVFSVTGTRINESCPFPRYYGTWGGRGIARTMLNLNDRWVVGGQLHVAAALPTEEEASLVGGGGQSRSGRFGR